MKRIFLLAGIAGLCALQPLRGQEVVEWRIASLPGRYAGNIDVHGDPRVVATPLGDAVWFDGADDGYMIGDNPLNGFGAFTLELVFRPDGDGYRKPRFMHFGDSGGKRLMCEIRINERGEWYFDAHFNAGDMGSKTLMDSTLTHPCDRWYTVAVVAANGTLTTYVDGKMELSGPLRFTPFDSGRTSVGFRQNHSSWFRGTIFRMRVSPGALKPAKFIKDHIRLNKKSSTKK